jgi:hypothetical protein
VQLSAYVNLHGVDPFTFDDFVFVGKQVAKDPSRLILVGGQAIETWGVVLDVPPPTGDHQPLTEDTDWLGGKRDAQWLCALLGAANTELQLAGDEHGGVSSALAFLRRPDGRVVLMDFLRCIAGVSNSDLQKLAVSIKVRDITLNVLHPLHCLDSRLANLALIPSKRTGNGKLQAVWAIDIARAYLTRVVADGPKRQAIRAAHRIAESAEYKHGRYCFLNFELDPLAAVSSDIVTAIGGEFEATDWPLTVNRIVEKRQRWVEIEERRRNGPPAKPAQS